MSEEKDRTIEYPVKTIRLADETWEKLNHKRKRSGKTWNLFLLALLKRHEQHKNKNN